MFWESFERICRERGEAPSTVFRALGLSPTNITRIKNGGSVRNSTVKKIAAYFGVTVSELIGESPIMTEEPEAEGTEQEKELIAQFRGTTPAGRLRMIQAVMNIYDEEEKKKPAANKNAAG